jgi:hypothetical protein
MPDTAPAIRRRSLLQLAGLAMVSAVAPTRRLTCENAVGTAGFEPTTP